MSCVTKFEIHHKVRLQGPGFFALVWKGFMCIHSETHGEDEPVFEVILLNFSMKQLMEVHLSQWMKQKISETSRKSVAISIIFVS